MKFVHVHTLELGYFCSNVVRMLKLYVHMLRLITPHSPSDQVQGIQYLSVTLPSEGPLSTSLSQRPPLTPFHSVSDGLPSLAYPIPGEWGGGGGGCGGTARGC